MKKKFLAVLCIAILSLTILTGCGNDSGTGQKETGSAKSTGSAEGIQATPFA